MIPSKWIKRPSEDELVVNGGPKFTNTTGWTAAGNGSISVVGGNIRLTTSGATGYFHRTINCEVGKQYAFTVHIPSRSMNGNTFLYAGTSGGNASMGSNGNGNDNTIGVGFKRLIFKATQSTVYITFSSSSLSQAGNTCDVGYLSVKEY